MPLYTLRHKVSGETVQTTDPGRALISGKWNDIGRFKGPILRGLATRAPYFHNGSAKDLNEAVEFYDTRFGMGLTAEREDRPGGVFADALTRLRRCLLVCYAAPSLIARRGRA